MDRVLGCGIDIEEFDRFRKYFPLEDEVPDLFRMVFTEEEISCNSEISPHLTFLVAFSCKEAVFKAFGRSWTNSGLDWKEIEIIFNNECDLKDHDIRLGGYAKELFDEMGCTAIQTHVEFNEEFVVSEVLFLSD
jgi:phosphopantetheine--protein transferase-like protein